MFKQLPKILPEKMVGETGIEPATSWSRTKRATRLRYSPIFYNFFSIRKLTKINAFHFSLNFQLGQRFGQHFVFHPSKNPRTG